MSPSLLDALESVQEWKAGGMPGADEPTARGRQQAAPREKTEAEIVEQNNRALQAIMAKMPRMKIG